MHHVADQIEERSPLESVRKASQGCSQPFGGKTGRAHFPRPANHFDALYNRAVLKEEYSLGIWRFFYPISIAAERSGRASNSWDTSGRLSSSLAHLDPQGPQTWRVLHIAVRLTYGSRAHDFEYREWTALGLPHRCAWRGDGTGSHPSPSLFDRQRSSEGTRHVEDARFPYRAGQEALLSARALPCRIVSRSWDRGSSRRPILSRFGSWLAMGSHDSSYRKRSSCWTKRYDLHGVCSQQNAFALCPLLAVEPRNMRWLFCCDD